MRIETTKNFLTPQECDRLNTITQYGHDNGMMTLGLNTNLRYTSRIDTSLYTYPQDVFDLAARVRTYCGVSAYPIITGQGSDAIVTNYMPTGADIFSYTSLRNSDGAGQFWAFIVTQAPDDGGMLQLNGTPFPVEAGELYCYMTSETEQYTTPVVGPTTRICWMFGNWVPPADWENGTIIFGG